jgi:hypothetical protein
VIYRELQTIQDSSGRRADARIIGACFNEKDATTAILGQSCGNNRARGAGTDYDFVEHVSITAFAVRMSKRKME